VPSHKSNEAYLYRSYIVVTLALAREIPGTFGGESGSRGDQGGDGVEESPIYML
jgi:hypothetical protein